MKRSTILIPLLAAALALAGCGDDAADNAATNPTSSSPTSSSPATPTGDAAQDASPTPTAPGGTAPAAEDSPECGVDPYAPAVTAAIDELAGGPWSYTGESNYNPCAQLSYAVADVPQGTGSSPRQFALFHDGEFIGTTTRCAFGLTSVVGANENSMTVRYRWPIGDESNAAGSGVAFATYTWDGATVVMDPPFPADMPGTAC